MNGIYVEGVRCFRQTQTIPLRPVTIFVGENSSGKSTILAAIRMAWNICQGGGPIDFNEEPFLLGGYEQLASYRSGRAGRAKCFRIGAQIKTSTRLRKLSPHKLPRVMLITGCFGPRGSQPAIQEWTLDAGPFGLTIDYGHVDRLLVNIKTPSGAFSFQTDIGAKTYFSLPILFSLSQLVMSEDTSDERKIGITGTIPTKEDAEIFDRIGYDIFTSLGPRPFAFAPIRSRPERTYDPLSEIPRSEGSHVPMILATIKSANPKTWESLRSTIDNFGKASGLFEDVQISRKGNKESDPFQITIKISGPPFNLVDVGYGVSQVLPILVESIRLPKGSTLLLQQPEVHLHPRAQAELGSFIGMVAKANKKNFVVETHSDYLVDRIRMDIRDGKHLSSRDVAVYYFHHSTSGVQIHQMRIDKFGNLRDSPKYYRQFFLDEESRLIGG